MITRSGLADEIDGFDVQIKAMNEAKSAAYKAYREQLEDAGMEPRRASAEVAATKAAIVKRRKLRENPDAAREKDDMIDAILVEIMERPSRAREASQSYAEAKGVQITPSSGDVYADLGIERTDEITEHEQPETADEFQAKASEDNGATGSVNAEVPSDCMTGEVSRVDAGRTASATSEIMDVTAGETAPHSNPQPTSSPEADKTGEAVPPPSVSPVALSDDDVPAFIKKDKDGCLKLKDGHCRISFATSALCSFCNSARSQARAGA